MLGTAVLVWFLSLVAASGVTLRAIDGRRLNPLEDPAAQAVVLIFTRSDCPISNRYAPELERLFEKYHAVGIQFWLVYIDPSEPEDAIRKHVAEYGYRFGALLDRKHELVALAKATVTPEAAVFVKDRLVYRGRIDNRYVAFGKARPLPTEHDLEQALEAVAAGRPLVPGSTHAIGCFIEDVK